MRAEGGEGGKRGTKRRTGMARGKVEVNVKYINGALGAIKAISIRRDFSGISYQSAPSSAPFNLPGISVIRVICNDLYSFGNLLLVTLESFY